jgi:hypothetical protein
MYNETELRIGNITAIAALKHGSKKWVLNRRDKTNFGSSTDEIFRVYK